MPRGADSKSIKPRPSTLRAQWNPWHGCHKCSPGCQNCYVFYLDALRDRDANIVTKSKTNFNLPRQKTRAGTMKIAPGSEVATCFTSDFFIAEADPWRPAAWQIIKQRPDLNFLICTKRIARVAACLPPDWGAGYANVTLAVSCENQAQADARLPIFLQIPAQRKQILVAPILEHVALGAYLASGQIAAVTVGGESYANARVCDFDWVRQIKQTCDQYGVQFAFHQTGGNFRKDGKLYHLSHAQEYAQARKAQALLAQGGRDAD